MLSSPGFIRRAALGAPLLVLAAFAAAPAHAVQYVHRCIGASGEPSYTDQACSAAAVNASATRSATAGGMRLASVRRVGAPAPIADCARTPQELQQRADAALVTHDAVRLSGLILWQSISPRAARRSLLSLARLAQKPADLVVQPPTAIDIDDPTAAGGSVDMATLVSLRSAATTDADTPVYEFRYTVAQRRGCYWLKPVE